MISLETYDKLGFYIFGDNNGILIKYFTDDILGLGLWYQMIEQ